MVLPAIAAVVPASVPRITQAWRIAPRAIVARGRRSWRLFPGRDGSLPARLGHPRASAHQLAELEQVLAILVIEWALGHRVGEIPDLARRRRGAQDPIQRRL